MCEGDREVLGQEELVQVLALDLALPKPLVYPEVKFLLLQKALRRIEWLMHVKSLANSDVP